MRRLKLRRLKRLSPRRMAALALMMMSPALAKAQQPRSLYVWSTSALLENLSGERAQLFQFCSSPPGYGTSYAIQGSVKPVTTLYLAAYTYVIGDATKRSKLRSFLSDAHARGMKVEFLDGAPEWATTSQASAERHLDSLLSFNNVSGSANERFDGVQFDIEPYLLTGWFTQTIWDGFIDIVSRCQSKIDAASSTLTFGVAAPRWYDSNPGANYLYQLQSKVDYIAVMNYVDNTNSMINDIANEINNAKQLGKKVVLAVETMTVTPSSVTFLEEGWGNMEGRLYEVNRRYETESSFAGIAVHHYPTYSTLTQWGTGGLDLTPPSTIDYRYVATANGGYFKADVIDVCGGGVDAAGTGIGSVVQNGTASISGTWAAVTGGVQFTPTASIDAGGLYRLILSPKDTKGNSRKDTVQISVAGRPLSLLPLSGAMGLVTVPKLVWAKSYAAQNYHVQVSRDSLFSQLLVNDSSVVDTSLSLSVADSQSYYWRVKAKNERSFSRYSQVFQFTTGKTDLIASTGGPLPLPDTTSTTGALGRPKKKRS